jgi:hypothetical protein
MIFVTSLAEAAVGRSKTATITIASFRQITAA